MAKVSIIIPTYNVEEYLEECMDSVVRQTLQDIEIICINDGSTDGSLEILKRYAQNDKRIIIVDKENGGYGIGMNIGLDKATGEYIGIVEPDDFVPLNMYEDLYNIAEKENLDFVKADFYRFKRSGNGNMDLVYNHLSKNEEDYNVVFNPSTDPKTLLYIMNTWSGIYRRSFLEEYHIRHNETPGASFQDNGFFWQTFIYAKRAMIINKPYYMNRRDNPNSSVHNPDKVYCINKEYDFIREILMQDKKIWNRFKYIYWVKKLSNYLATVKRIGEEYKREYIRAISKEFCRAEELGELKKDVFTEEQWKKLQFLMRDPEGFSYKVISSGTTAFETTYEVDRIKNSTSYKLGRLLTKGPRKIKQKLKTK
ncbi:MAG: glycosyltransferase family 2 protein [Mediterraneibacter sp.]